MDMFPHELLAELVMAHVDADRPALCFQASDTGHFNSTFFVEGAARPLVLRIAPADDVGLVFYEKGMMAQEPTVHALIRERTSVPVPEILAYDHSRRLIDRDYLLMERLPGAPLSQCSPTRVGREKILAQVGEYLRQIHQITADRYGYLGEHNCMEPQSTWAAAFRIMWAKLIDDVSDAGYCDAGERRRITGLLDRHFALFDRPVTSRLLHMDIWGQNILVDEYAHVTGLIDFDRALWGDKGIEFAVLDYCGISEAAFWQGYDEPRDRSPAAMIRRAFYIAYEVLKYIPIYHWRNGDPVTAARYKREALAILDAVG